jgi:hypothetical protein
MQCKLCKDQTCQLCLASSAAAIANTEVTAGGGIVASGPAAVARFRIFAIYNALKLQAQGFKTRGRSALSVVRSEFGVTVRTADRAVRQFEEILKERGLLK